MSSSAYVVNFSSTQSLFWLKTHHHELCRKFNGASLDTQPFIVLYEKFKWAIRNRIRTLELDDIHVTFVISLDAYYFCVGSEPLRLGVESGCGAITPKDQR